jgi:hypothetical protein
VKEKGPRMASPGRRIFPARSADPSETWQVDAAPLPVWLPSESGTPSRAWVAVCASVESGRSESSDPGPREKLTALIEEVLSRAGWRWRAHPARIQVNDVALAGVVERLAEPYGVTVEVRDDLPAVRRVMKEVVAATSYDDDRPGALTGEGVTVERLAAFARAAVAIHAAPCWRWLGREDLVRIEAPEVEEALRCFSMTRRAPPWASEILFFPDAKAFNGFLTGDFDEAAEQGLWTVSFETLEDAPPEDLEIWDRHGLPWIDGRICPVVSLLGFHRADRPDSRRLAFIEGLLTALAFTSRGELDSGRWEKWVETSDGPVRYVLSVADLKGVREDRVSQPAFQWKPVEMAPEALLAKLTALACQAGEDPNAFVLAGEALDRQLDRWNQQKRKKRKKRRR